MKPIIILVIVAVYGFALIFGKWRGIRKEAGLLITVVGLSIIIYYFGTPNFWWGAGACIASIVIRKWGWWRR